MVYLLLVAMIGGCAPKGQHKGLEQKAWTFAEPTALQVSDSMEIGDMFNLLTWKISGGTLCLVTANQPEGFLSAYSLDGKKLYSYGSIGQGPGEFYTLNAGEAMAGDVLLYDIMNRRVVQFSIGNDTLHIAKTLSLYNDEEGMCKPFTFISQIKEDTYLMKVDERDSSFWDVVDLGKGKVLASYANPLRKEGKPYTPFNFLQSISGSVLAAAYTYMDRIEFYSLANDTIVPQWVFGNDKDQSDAKSYENLANYYLSVVSCPESFVCLKSTDGTRLGNRVEVYGTDGSCKASYVLSRPVSSIHVDADGCLVGYVADVDRTILYRFADVL